MLSETEYRNAVDACFFLRTGIDDLLAVAKRTESSDPGFREGIGRLCNALDAVHETMRAKADRKDVTLGHDLWTKRANVLRESGRKDRDRLSTALRREYQGYISADSERRIAERAGLEVGADASIRVHAGYYLTCTQPMREISRDATTLERLGIYGGVVALVELAS